MGNYISETLKEAPLYTIWRTQIRRKEGIILIKILENMQKIRLRSLEFIHLHGTPQKGELYEGKWKGRLALQR